MTKRYLILLVLASLFTIDGCASLKQREDKLSTMELQVADVQQTQAGLNVRLDELNNKLFVLEDRIKENTREIQDIKSLAIPIPPGDLKVVRVAPQEKTVAKSVVREEEASPMPKNPDELYQAGYTLFAEGKMGKARMVFDEFLKSFPKHPLSDNARYWLGEIYYTEKNFPLALKEFQRVVDDYPEENKAPDALLKISLTYIELAEHEKARDTLKKLIGDYPSSEAARIAQDTLLKVMR